MAQVNREAKNRPNTMPTINRNATLLVENRNDKPNVRMKWKNNFREEKTFDIHFAMAYDKFMTEAFVEARRALSVGEVPVGCVFVYHNAIIARGANEVNATKNATRHAEFVCIDQVLEYCRANNLQPSDVFAGISVVVTVEPCIMCSAALHDLKVKEIIYGCANDRFGGKTVVDVPKVVDYSLTITGGLRADEAMDLLKDFYKGENPSAPVAKTKR